MAVATRGSRKAPPRLRDKLGRFVSERSDAVIDLMSLVKEFERTGTCTFPDPWHDDGGTYTVERGHAMKGYPVRMIYKGPRDGPGALIKYGRVGSFCQRVRLQSHLRLTTVTRERAGRRTTGTGTMRRKSRTQLSVLSTSILLCRAISISFGVVI